MINNVPAFIWFLNRDLQSAKLMVSTSGSCTAECKTYIANIESKIRTFYIGAIITFNGDQKKTLSYPGLKKDFNSYETSVLGEISRQFQVLQSH